MGIVRLASGFSIPAFITGSTITTDTVFVHGHQHIQNNIRDMVGLSLLSEEGEGELQEDWIEQQEDDGVKGGVKDGVKKRKDVRKRSIPGEWVMHKSAEKKEIHQTKVVLYLHGGAHIFMSPRTHRSITSHISLSSNCPVYAIDYRLAPEHTFPSAIEDALAAYLALIDPAFLPSSWRNMASLESDLIDAGVFSNVDARSSRRLRPEQIVVAGDSSGGCLSMQLLLALRNLGLPMPGGAVLLSPFVDHERTSDSWRRNWNSDFMSLDPLGVEWALRCVASSPEISNSHPIFSPIHADLYGLCPLLIQAGEAEVLTDDAIRLHANAMQQGVKSELNLFKDMFHVFHTFPFASASSEAFRRIGKFISDLDISPKPISPRQSPSRTISSTSLLSATTTPISTTTSSSPKKKSKRSKKTKRTPSESSASSTSSSAPSEDASSQSSRTVISPSQPQNQQEPAWDTFHSGAILISAKGTGWFHVGDVTVDVEEIPADVIHYSIARVAMARKSGV
ncbi:hypothetical protein HDU97_004492 [Phlyctochytrium planicorne]|nr:hypothetical protein HDU97_004492 [Phlyctochytrium planicorne]